VLPISDVNWKFLSLPTDHFDRFNSEQGENAEDFMDAFQYYCLCTFGDEKRKLPYLAFKKWFKFYTFGKNMQTISTDDVKEAMLAAFDFDSGGFTRGTGGTFPQAQRVKGPLRADFRQPVMH
jgi:hypothetical protein